MEAGRERQVRSDRCVEVEVIRDVLHELDAEMRLLGVFGSITGNYFYCMCEKTIKKTNHPTEWGVNITSCVERRTHLSV